MKLKAQFYSRRRKNSALFWLYLLLIPLCFSCKDDSTEDQFDPNAPVEVTAIIPETGIVALPLVIHGKNFGTDRSKIQVLFDDVQAQIITVKNEHLYVLNPRQTEGDHTVKVVVEGKEGVLEHKFNYVVSSSVATVAGSGEDTYKDGSVFEASFGKGPEYISIDDKDNIFSTENNGKYFRLISLNENKVTTLLSGKSTFGSSFSSDFSTLYVAIESNSSILSRELDCTANYSMKLIPNTFGDDMYYGTPALTVDKEGNVYYIGYYYGTIVRKDIKTEELSILGYIPEDMLSGTDEDYYAAYNPKDNYVYVSHKTDHIILRFPAGKDTLEDEDFEIYAGSSQNSGLKNGKRQEALFNKPRGMAFDSKGNMYIADTNNNMIRMINPEGIVSTFVGKPEGGHKDGALEESLFKNPYDVAISPEDFIYVADYGNRRIRCIAIQ